MLQHKSHLLILRVLELRGYLDGEILREERGQVKTLLKITFFWDVTPFRLV
jgi:hypothetical protein